MWVALLQIALVGYLTSLVLLIVKGINPDGTLRRAQAARWSLAAAAAFALLALALWKA